MRIRFKPWARSELEASSFYRDNPEELKGKWIQEFKNKENPIHLELGCGKGQFISQIAFQNPEINYIAIDLVDAMLGLAKRNVEQIYQEHKKEVDNLLLTRFDIERINLIEKKLNKYEMKFAKNVADEVVFMEGGHIVEMGLAHEVFENPKEERTRQFLSKNNE